MNGDCQITDGPPKGKYGKRDSGEKQRLRSHVKTETRVQFLAVKATDETLSVFISGLN